MAKPREWVRLDNAAMMFPAVADQKNTRVFRFCCQLCEEVDPELLQRALDETVAQNPSLLCCMRSGVFWHYLEHCRYKPEVKPERFTPCFPIYSADRKRLLFYVSYHRKRINVEFFHALTDGTGGIMFIRVLVIRYLRLAHPELQTSVPAADFGAARSSLTEDSFGRHYSASSGRVRITQPRAYQIPGAHTDERRYRMVEGLCSARAVLALAHSYNTTMTGLLCAMLMRAVASTMTDRDRKLPVTVTVPVNLRGYFSSDTARNFFVTTCESYSFAEGDGSMEDIIRVITEAFKANITKEKLSERMDSMVVMQRDSPVRFAPLVLKDFAMAFSKRLNERGETAVLSNVGRIELPEELQPYVDRFAATSSTSNMHLCAITYGDRLCLSFSSSLLEPDVERHFLRSLTAAGVEVEVTSNYNQEHTED